MTDQRYRPEQLESFTSSVLRAVGVADGHAVVTARRLVEADVRGRTGHGLIRVGPYVERIEAGGLNLEPRITVRNETPTSALIDGDNGLGQVVMTQATELAISKAREMGMAWVGSVSSNHAGAAGIYPLMAAREGMVGIYLAVANANGMPPWGGTDRLLGTNPIAIAVPAGDDDPFLLDIATTVTSHGSIKVKAQAGEPMPEGWVVDADGQPITDPARAHEGYLMPIGGYKGSGLNIAIGLLAGVLNGAAFGRSVIDHREELSTPTNTGQAIMVMRADLFRPAGEVAEAMADQLDELRQASGPGGAPVRLPGDRAAQLAAENLEIGVPLPGSLVVQLDELAERLGVEPLAPATAGVEAGSGSSS